VYRMPRALFDRGKVIASALSELGPVDKRDSQKAYLAHAVLGLRLVACSDSVIAFNGKSLHDISGRRTT
jgi:uncharacterized protein (DUF1810 family)